MPGLHPHTPERTDLADAAGTSEAFGVDPTLTAVALGALEVDGHPIDHPDAHTEIESALHRPVQALGHLPAGTWHTGP